MTETRSPFLDILPPDLRLHIYTHLLVSPTPIKGPAARLHQAETYGLNTAILRTNKQIHDEARTVFLGRNTFSINSLPPLTDDDEDDDDGNGAFEPPLQLADLPLIRHLHVDLLYYPNVLKTAEASDGLGWTPACLGAERYINSLSFLLSFTKGSLLSLKLKADVRPHTPANQEFDVKKFLTGFHVVDQSLRFKQALQVPEVSLRFDFADVCFDFVVERERMLRGSLVQLAGLVVMKRSEIGLKGVLEDLGREIEKKGVPGRLEDVTLAWPLSTVG
jgi:hypothetical protein